MHTKTTMREWLLKWKNCAFLRSTFAWSVVLALIIQWSYGLQPILQGTIIAVPRTRIAQHAAAPEQAFSESSSVAVIPASSESSSEVPHLVPLEEPVQSSASSDSSVMEPEVSSPASSRSPSPIVVPVSPSSSAVSSASSSSMTSTSSAESSSTVAPDAFPAFGRAMLPVSRIPNWGEMRSPAEWDQSYGEMDKSKYVPVPAYDLTVLTRSMDALTHPYPAENISAVTAKLFYSTRFFGAYDVDAGEFTARHAGIDLKLPYGTPVGAVAGGRVRTVSSEGTLGLHVIIEHRAPDGQTYYSIYGHLSVARVAEGDAVEPGQTVGLVGMTGQTTAPHLHLQIDRGAPGEEHVPYWPPAPPTPAEVRPYTVNPITFVRQFGG